jgi:uncharacterized protein YtpQ (UPF0354 family)
MTKLLFSLSLILLFCSCGNQNRKNKGKIISEKEFTKIYSDSLKKYHPEITYTIKQDLEIHAKSNELDFIHYLNNAYTSYKNEPDSLASVIQMYLKSSADLYKIEQPIQKDKIIPVIKDAAYIDDMAITLNANNKTNEPVELVYEKYNDKLVIVYAEDGENGIAYFTADRFKESGLNKDSLFILAMKNLDNILPEIQRNGEDGYYMLTAGGNYETSLILIKSIWSKENIPVKGDIIIAVPTRDLLLVTGSKDPEGISKMRAVAKEAYEAGPYQLTPDLFHWDGKKFEPYK